MKYLVRIGTVFIFLIANRCLAQGFELQQKHYTVPVVKESPYTALIRVAITIPAGKDSAFFLQQLSLSLQQVTGKQAINTIKIYSTTDSNYLNQEKTMRASQFAVYNAARATTGIVKINGNLRFAPGTNYIWVGLSLKQSADIADKIRLCVTGIVVNSNPVSLPTPSQLANFRIASAVRQSMQDNVHTSRIPGIATATNGDLLAIYDARYDSKRDLQGDIDIALNRSTDKGNTWLPIQRIIDMGRWGGLPEKFNGVSDPCILVDERSGVIFVAGLWMHGLLDGNGQWMQPLSDTSTVWNHQWRNKGSQPGFDPKQTAQFLIVKSTDNGKTWSKPVNITKMCKKEEWWLWAPAPGRGFTMSDGTLVLPTQGRDKNGAPFSNITYSKDGGVTWVTSNPASTGTSECAAAQLSDGSVMLNMRTNANKGLTGEGNGRAIAVTSNLGKTWAEHNTSRKALPEPVCMGSLYKHTYFKDGRKKSVLLFLNPNSTTGRNHITLKASFDNGNTWPSQKYILLDELSGFGYSCITSVDNDTIGVLYESSQAQLVFQQISLKEITE